MASVAFLNQPSIQWVFATTTGNYFCIGVDLFLMLSGALSLGRDWDIRTFLGKRIPRIVGPFLFWGFVLSIVMVCASFVIPNMNVLNHLDLMSYLNYLGNCYMARNMGFTPYWFFWMILGTYLIMPIFNKWLLHCDMKEVEYFLVIWIISSIFLYTLVDVTFPIKLSYFTSPIGMVVLGYYLRHTDRRILNNPYFAIFLMAMSFIACYAVSTALSTPDAIYRPERYDIFHIMTVTGVFMLFKNFSKLAPGVHLSDGSLFKKSAFSIAKYSYGIYLIHRVVLLFVHYFMRAQPGYIVLDIELILMTLILSWAIMAILNRVPYVNQVIGAK